MVIFKLAFISIAILLVELMFDKTNTNDGLGKAIDKRKQKNICNKNFNSRRHHSHGIHGLF
jgi:hypothetical protein